MYERRDPGAIPPAIEEIQVFAQETGLRYVRDGQDGYTRRRFGKGFVFFDQQKRITDAKTVQRIKALVIPPAWRDVWICKHGNGHLQATGRDARGRKQYRYHAKWNEARNETKFAKLLQFGEALPQIRLVFHHQHAHRRNLDTTHRPPPFTPRVRAHAPETAPARTR